MILTDGNNIRTPECWQMVNSSFFPPNRSQQPAHFDNTVRRWI